jgi:hypothetical protein
MNTALDSSFPFLVDEKAMSGDMRQMLQAAREPVGGEGSMTILQWMARAGELVPSWWSQQRDTYIRRFWLGSDVISGAMYSVVSRVCAIPCKVVARDMNVQSHQELAALYDVLLFKKSQLLQGWSKLLEHALQDYLGQDNGMFIEVLGHGDPAGPLTGPPISLLHRDASRCIRTSDPEFPVVYYDRAGRRYKLHYTRIIYASQLPSPASEMNGVGFCAVSRCINAAQNLIDIARYKQEKMGSRPPRQILVGKGISARDIGRAFQIANTQMTAENLSLFSKTVVLGSTDTNVGLDQIDLASVPDGFDENTVTNLGVYIVALAFGTDARDFWPATSSGATKADALVQHMKARGKGTAQILQMLVEQMENKFLPDELMLVFDLQDDEEDEMQAGIRDKRATTRKVDLDTGIVDMRVAREHAARDGDMTKEQFEELELEDGRLPDGMPVLTLFHSKDPLVQELLKLPVPDPMELLLSKRAEHDALVRQQKQEDENYRVGIERTAQETEIEAKKPKPVVANAKTVGEDDSEEKPVSAKPVVGRILDAPELPPELQEELPKAIINCQRRVVWASTARIKRIALQCLACLITYQEALMGKRDPITGEEYEHNGSFPENNEMEPGNNGRPSISINA